VPETLTKCKLCDARDLEEIDRRSAIWRCAACGYVFDNPRPTLDEIVAYYSTPRKYDAWLEKERAREALWRRRVRKVEKHKKPGTLLDIGAGIGQFLHLARHAFTELYGTEVSESAVAIAREKYGLEISRTAIEDAEFGRTRFDNITLFHVLEHMHDPGAAVEKCFSLLSDGGMLFIAVPNDLLSLRNRVRKALHRLGVKRIAYAGRFGLPRISLDGSLSEIHLSHFTPPVLRQFLVSKGFSIVENGLDPYYAESGMKLVLHTVYYHIQAIITILFRKNLYDTIWIAARKSGLYRESEGK
jgi:SAM-dependent methyltransferase